MKNIVVLISGRGSNFVAIAQACERENWAAEGIRISLVLSNRPDAAGLERAKEMGIGTAVVDHKAFETREDFERAMIEIIDKHNPDVVVLAGFMRVLTPVFVDHYEGKILNIHPAILPLFPGLETQRRAIEAGCRVHGSTVHFVSAVLDGGAIIGQSVVPILASDTPETLAARLLPYEHALYPKCVRAVALGEVRLENGRAVMRDEVARSLAVFPTECAARLERSA